MVGAMGTADHTNQIDHSLSERTHGQDLSVCRTAASSPTRYVSDMDLEQTLHRHFGFSEFRPGQRAVVDHIVAGHDALVVMPTGHGKSLCYQLPALALGGTAIVVSPLIALMKDQVDALRAKGIRATLINSSLSWEERRDRTDAMIAGEYQLVYVAPERFSDRFMQALARTNVTLLAIDEAHCISQWGHDFRPDYLRLGAVRQALAGVPTIALTATATPAVADDILAQLQAPETRRFVTGFDRENLRLEVATARSPRAKHSMLPGLLQSLPALVYCATRKHVEAVTETLAAQGFAVAAYHAGIDHDSRRRVQEDFIAGKLPVVVATNAFGMGVDKADIRTIVHFDLPGTIEAYYQEVGRAGRDRKPATAVLLYRAADRQLQEFFIQNSHPPAADVHRVYSALRAQGENPVWLGPHEIGRLTGIDERQVQSCLSVLRRCGLTGRAASRDTDTGDALYGVQLTDPDCDLDLTEAEMDRRRHPAFGHLERMVGYGNAACQRATLLRYFGEEPSWDRCGRCTGCDAGRPMVEEARTLTDAELEVVRKILACMARMRRAFSVSMICKVVTGSRDKSVRAWDFDKLSTWGILQGTSQARVESILGAMEAGGLIEVELTSKAVRGQTRTWKNLGVSPLGWSVMKGEETDVQLAMPPLQQATMTRIDISEGGDGVVDEDLLARLRQVRRELAQAASVPAYVVASNRTLLGIAAARPTSEDALMEIHGMGRQRVARYGASFVEAVRGWTGC
jgi:ATP-dependent DNA helicase RecQ